ncbi:MAG: lipopolysaccharide heptosyltransferase II [Phycisphaerales bacterium JB059]
MPRPALKPHRLLIVLPSWVGDAVMATPALRRVRSALPGAFIGALARPGVDQLLAGSDLFDEVHVERASGVLGPKFVAAKLRPRRYDTALLLTNSFSTALIARVAGIPRRVGYNRDARRLLLTDPLPPERTPRGRFAIVPAVNAYWSLASSICADAPAPPRPDQPLTSTHAPLILPPEARLELTPTPAQQADAARVLESARIGPDQPFAILNPGGNNPAKRWPPDRFALVADHLRRTHGLRVLVNTAPTEIEIARAITENARTDPVPLADHASTLGALLPLCARASVMVTNDTGPRHIAAAMGAPLVSLFGPTDPRWTTIPVRPLADGRPSEVVVAADPQLPIDESANDHPQRCSVDRITTQRVTEAVDSLLA